MKLINLIKKEFDMFCQWRWLREIRKETKALKRAKFEVKRHRYILNALLTRYMELYPDVMDRIKESMNEKD